MPNFLASNFGIAESLADTAAPTSGTYQIFDTVWNSSPAVGQPMGWVCTAGGSPGTWVPFSTLANPSAPSTLAAAGNVASTVNILTTTGTTYNITLALPTVNNTNLYVVNLASGTITAVAATGAAVVGLATIVTATSGSFRSSSTNWYRT